MRLINLLLLACLILIQFPLWYGRGGWFYNEGLQAQLKVAQQKSHTIKLRNEKLRSEVEDLDTGTEALEERARQELGLVHKDEMYIQILDKPLPVVQVANPVETTLPINTVKKAETTTPKADVILQVPKD